MSKQDRECEREMEERMDEALYYASKDADDLAKADAEIAALKQRVAELERELEAARKMREFVELAAAGPPSCARPRVAQLWRHACAPVQRHARLPCGCGASRLYLRAPQFVELVAAGPDFHLNDYTRTIQEKAKAALAAYRQATQTKEPRDEKAK